VRYRPIPPRRADDLADGFHPERVGQRGPTEIGPTRRREGRGATTRCGRPSQVAGRNSVTW
jgi:hypothetical protein